MARYSWQQHHRTKSFSKIIYIFFCFSVLRSNISLTKLLQICYFSNHFVPYVVKLNISIIVVVQVPLYWKE